LARAEEAAAKIRGTLAALPSTSPSQRGSPTRSPVSVRWTISLSLASSRAQHARELRYRGSHAGADNQTDRLHRDGVRATTAVLARCVRRAIWRAGEGQAPPGSTMLDSFPTAAVKAGEVAGVNVERPQRASARANNDDADSLNLGVSAWPAGIAERVRRQRLRRTGSRTCAMRIASLRRCGRIRPCPRQPPPGQPNLVHRRHA
jgi:hypothetical protein